VPFWPTLFVNLPLIVTSVSRVSQRIDLTGAPLCGRSTALEPYHASYQHRRAGLLQASIQVVSVMSDVLLRR